jgi:Na+-translocating ferredoxin:NAD+ oxidoreductase subunit C
MERAKAQRAAIPPKNTETLTAAQQRDIAEIEARRAVLDPAAQADAAPVNEKTQKAE